MEPLTLFEKRAIDVPFDIGPYRLIPGCAGELGEPIEAFLELYAVSASHTRRIATPNDLAAITEAVHSEDEALAFVRLFTSPQTHYLFEKRRVLIDVVVADEAAGFGVVRRVVAQRLGLPAGHVTRSVTGFDIQRCLVGGDSLTGSHPVLLRSERVSTAGDYDWIDDRPLATLTSDEVTLPVYE
jgi:hypothetical protein